MSSFVALPRPQKTRSEKLKPQTTDPEKKGIIDANTKSMETENTTQPSQTPDQTPEQNPVNTQEQTQPQEGLKSKAKGLGMSVLGKAAAFKILVAFGVFLVIIIILLIVLIFVK